MDVELKMHSVIILSYGLSVE